MAGGGNTLVGEHGNSRCSCSDCRTERAKKEEATKKKVSKYAILNAIVKGEPATVQSFYEEVGEKDMDGDSIIEDLVALVSEGLVEEHE